MRAHREGESEQTGTVLCTKQMFRQNTHTQAHSKQSERSRDCTMITDRAEQTDIQKCTMMKIALCAHGEGKKKTHTHTHRIGTVQ